MSYGYYGNNNHNNYNHQNRFDREIEREQRKIESNESKIRSHHFWFMDDDRTIPTLIAVPVTALLYFFPILAPIVATIAIIGFVGFWTGEDAIALLESRQDIKESDKKIEELKIEKRHNELIETLKKVTPQNSDSKTAGIFSTGSTATS